MKFITKYFKIDSLPSVVKEHVLEVAKKNEVSQDSIEYTRKGLETYKQPDFVPNEKAVITYISTGTLDRDKDIVLPSGVDLTDYMKHPIVMFAHKYSDGLPLGRCAWIKSDATGHGLIAKTIYANTPQADLVYNYRKDGFPLAVSIGFLPTKQVSKFDASKKDEFNSEIKNALDKGWVTKDNVDSVNKIIQKWSLIEYSDTPVPSNSQALQIACSKGLISKEEYEDDLKTIIQIDGLKDISKIEDKEEEVKKVEESTKTLECVVKEISKDKTISPPLDLVSKNIVDNIEQKKSDKKGNPSTRDIQEAMYANMKKMKEDMDKAHTEKGIAIKYENSNSMSYMGIEDLYPLDYPHGHVVCGYSVDYSSPIKYCDYKYKYDAESKTCEMGKMTEMDISYVPKGICQAEISKINNDKELYNKFDNNLLSIDDFKNIPILNINFREYLADNLVVGIGLVKGKNDDFYQIRLNKVYIEGAKYVSEKQKQALEHFSKFVSDEPKSMDEWRNIQSKLIEFFIASAPGKEEIIRFCKDNKLKHKDYITKEQEEDEIIEKGVDETENEIRIRVQDPSLFDQDSFRYKTIKSYKPRVKAVFGKKKGSSSMELQAYRFPKEDGWTQQSAKTWVKEHGKKSYEYSEELSPDEIVNLVTGAIEKRNENLTRLIDESLQRLMGKAQI